MDLDKIKRLVEVMEENQLAELEISEAGESIRLVRAGVSAVQAPAAPPTPPAAPEAAVPVAGVNAPAAPLTGTVVSAEMVGTFYRSPSPSSPPFVDVGDRVKAGDTLCIIESMKMMNEIKAPCDGRVEAILVANAAAVEFDQPLVTIS